jgi:xylose isomerase
MKFATRVNSFVQNKAQSIEEIIEEIGKIEGITYIDLNYPEHFENNTVTEIGDILNKNDIKLNGVALRFREEFINGELGNSSSVVSQKAIELCKQAIDACRQLRGTVVTIWLGYDGYDYSFQIDYAKVWKQVVNALKVICTYNSDINISIEYKPFQPRAYSLVSSLGSTMTMINDVNCENLGATLDFCHMLMKNENPAFGVCLLGEKNKLYGVHLNDGCKFNDDGLMVGMVNFIQTLEFVYYLKKYNYDGIIYFDTFPVREDATLETVANVKMMRKINCLIERIGMEEIQKVIDKNDAIAVQEMVLDSFSV